MRGSSTAVEEANYVAPAGSPGGDPLGLVVGALVNRIDRGGGCRQAGGLHLHLHRHPR